VALVNDVELLRRVVLKDPERVVEFSPVVELNAMVALNDMVTFDDTSRPFTTVLMYHGALTNRPYLDRG
jgi:hypothetical protein